MRLNTGEWVLHEPTFASPRTLARRAAREVWTFLPAWMFLVYGCLLLNTELTNLDPPRPDLAYTAAFPIAVFIVFYGLRAATAPDVRHRWAMFGCALALAVLLPAANLAWHRPSPMSLPTLRLWYELSNFLWAGLLAAHAFWRRKSHLALFFGAGLLYGACLENGGILLGFFDETHLDTTRVGPLLAPVATMLGWCVVLYMAFFAVWQARRWVPWVRSPALSAVLVGLAATLLDLQIDPAATATGCWVWHPTLPPFFHGVPLVNFVAWMCALTPFAYVVFRYQQRARIADAAGWTPRQLGFAALAVPATLCLAAASFLVCTLLLEGANGPSWTVLYGFFDRSVQAAIQGLAR